jgi:SAM-dependent methyltransferase
VVLRGNRYVPIHLTDWQARYDLKYYSGKPGWLAGTEEFHRLCADTIRSGSRILEIGAGPSNPTSRFLSKLGELQGIDPDPEVFANDALARAHLLEGETFPIGEDSFDYCVSNYVVEHVRNPAMHIEEVKRVLKPGGAYIFRTPNSFHYVTLVARFTPQWFHAAVSNRARKLPSSAHDPYPTVYAMNSGAAVRRVARSTGMHVELIRYVEKEPSYGRFARPAYVLFMLYERIVNLSDLLARARANLFVVLRK